MEQYYPKRDRGVYRAAANPKNPLHAWGKKLVGNKSISGILAWVYRNRGYENVIRDLVYAKNPFLSLIPKEDTFGKYIPVPIIYRK